MTRSAIAWRATSAAAARIRRSRRRSARGATSHVRGQSPDVSGRDMARLIRTEKEVEGRREEIWLVVDEDALEQWPAGPRDVVGRPHPRNDGLARARGQARYTADVHFPGMLHAAVLRSPYPHARARRLDLASALAAPGVRGAIGPGDAPELSADCEY